MVSSVGNGKYVVRSEKTGKKLSKPASKKKTVKRLQQIEYFKHKGFKKQMSKVHKIMGGY